MTFQPFICPSCHAELRGDGELCPDCGCELYASAFTKGEQRSEDLVSDGRCELCERPVEECDADPESCIPSDDGTTDLELESKGQINLIEQLNRTTV